MHEILVLISAFLGVLIELIVVREVLEATVFSALHVCVVVSIIDTALIVLRLAPCNALLNNLTGSFASFS